MIEFDFEAALPYQERGLAWGEAHRKGWIAFEQGLGKSYLALAIALRLEGRLPAVVVCPAYLRLNWRNEIEKWTRGAKVCVVGKKGFVPDADFYVMSYEQTVAMVPPRGVRTLILDESRYAANKAARRTKAVRKLAATTPYVYMLDGTPLVRPINLWAMASAIGMTELTYIEWAYKFCGAYVNQWNQLDVRGIKNVEELTALFAKWSIRLTKQEALKLPAKMRRMVVLNVPLDTRERDYKIGEIEQANSIKSYIGLAEVLHEHGTRKIEPAVAHITDLLLSGEKPILVKVRHIDVAHGLRDRLNAKGCTFRVITGDTTMGERQRIVELFNAKEIDGVIGNNAMGAGLNMPGGRYGVVVEADWNFATNEQFEDRLHRIGQTLPVQWDYLVCDQSIDSQMVKNALKNKNKVNEILRDERRIEALSCELIG